RTARPPRVNEVRDRRSDRVQAPLRISTARDSTYGVTMRFSRVGVLGVLVAPAVAVAQPQPKFEFAKAEEVAKVKDVEWTAQAEAGIVFTTGNSETTTV